MREATRRQLLLLPALASLLLLFPPAPSPPPAVGATTTAPSTAPAASGACSGDCDASGSVETSEAVTAVVISLGRAPLNECPSADIDLDGHVGVVDLLTIVSNARHGCALPDLVVTDARYRRCTEPPCYRPPDQIPVHFMEICVRNQGRAATGPFRLARAEVDAATIEGLGRGEETCVEFRFEMRGEAIADAQDEVNESDESNNALPYTVPYPTSCDVLPPPCEETPTW